MTSYEIDEMFQVSGPQRIDIRGARRDILKEDMAASDKVRISTLRNMPIRRTIGRIRSACCAV